MDHSLRNVIINCKGLVIILFKNGKCLINNSRVLKKIQKVLKKTLKCNNYLKEARESPGIKREGCHSVAV